jgi:hypothetical protein
VAMDRPLVITPMNVNGSDCQDLRMKIFRRLRVGRHRRAVRSASPLVKAAPVRTRATRWGAFTQRQRAWADSISLPSRRRANAGHCLRTPTTRSPGRYTPFPAGPQVSTIAPKRGYRGESIGSRWIEQQVSGPIALPIPLDRHLDGVGVWFKSMYPSAPIRQLPRGPAPDDIATDATD